MSFMKKHDWTITEDLVLYDLDRIKKHIKAALKQGKWKNAKQLIVKAADLLYNTNVEYFDEELEMFTKEIESKSIKKTDYNPVKSNVVLYDYYMLDNRGLTEQYLDALECCGYNILYIVNREYDSRSVNIRKRIEDSDVIKTVVVDSDNVAQSIYSAVVEFGAERFLVHNSPSDIDSAIALSALDGQCERLIINITDHAFWLGAGFIDKCIEFRNYGANVSRLYRKIPDYKLYKLPYYPIANREIKFKGFGFDTDNKRLIVSGGAIYKIKGNSGFFELVSHILDNYKDAIFLYLGYGDEAYILNFIRNHHYEGRFFFEPERNDIFRIIEKCYLYLNTYPVCGALLTQLAMVCGKIPITVASATDCTDSDMNELLFCKTSVRYLFESIKDAKNMIDSYMADAKLLAKAGQELSNCIISKQDFSMALDAILYGDENPFEIESYMPDDVALKRTYLKSFNEEKTDYYQIFLSRHFLWLNIINIRYFLRHLRERIKDGRK